MGIDPRVFGPSFWGALHLACFFPENPDKVREFIKLYQYVLPCIGCRMHFEKILEEFPVPESDGEMELFEWSVFVHNEVNKSTGKPTLSIEEAKYIWVDKKVNQIIEEDKKKNSKGVPLWIIIVAVLLVTLLIIKMKLGKE